MTLEKKIASGFRIEAVADLSHVISGAVLIVLLARLLEPDGYGLLYFALSIMGVGTLISSLGFGRSAARYLTEYDEKSPGQVPHIVETSVLYTLSSLAVVSIAIVIFRSEITVFLGESGLEPFLTLGVLYLIGGTIKKYTRRVLQGFKRIRESAILTITSSLCSVTVTISLVLLGYGAIGAFTGHAISSVITAIVGTVFTSRQYISYKRAPIEEGLRRRIFEYSMPLSLTASGDILIKRVDIILIGFFLTPVFVGYYTVSKQIVTFAQTPAKALGFSISPRYKEQYEKGNIEQAAKLYENALTSILLIYIPATAGLIIVASPTIELLFGADYIDAVPVLQVLSLFLVAQTITYITSSGLDYLGQAKLRAYAKGSVAIGNFTLNILLIPIIGIIGAAISTVLAYAVYAALNVYFMHLELRLNWNRLLQDVSQIIVITSIMSVVVLSFVGTISGIFTLFAVVGLGCAVWLTLSYLLGFVEEKQIRTVIGQ